MALFPRYNAQEAEAKYAAEKEAYEKRIEALNAEIKSYQARESTVVSALAEAEKLAEARVAAAEERAERICREAEAERARIEAETAEKQAAAQAEMERRLEETEALTQAQREEAEAFAKDQREEAEAKRNQLLEEAEARAKAIREEANAMGEEMVEDAIGRVDSILGDAHKSIREAVSFSANLIKSLKLMSIQAEAQSKALCGALELLESRQSLLEYNPAEAQRLDKGEAALPKAPAQTAGTEGAGADGEQLRVWTVEELLDQATEGMAQLDAELSALIDDVVKE